MKRILLFITIIIYFTTLFGQSNKGEYSISGQLKISVDSELIIPSDKPSIFIGNSLGYFRIDSLKSGVYHLRIEGWGYKADTVIHIEDKAVKNLNFQIGVDCDVNKSFAEKDIQNNNIRLLLIGSIVPIGNTYQDKAFENKYNLKYYDYGCTPPAIECVIQYNNKIFEYLDSKFGGEWKITVRKDVIGLRTENDR